MLKLYSLPLSPFAARVRGAIYAKNLPVEIVKPPEGWRASEDFRALNPLMRIPVLVLEDGTGLPESGVIVEYLEDKFPNSPLRPQSPEALSRVRLIAHVAELYVMQAIMPLFYMFDAETRDETAINQQLGKLDDGLAKLDALLKKGSHAYGGTLSTADVWLTPVCFTIKGLMGFASRADLLDRHAALAAYVDVIKNEPPLARVWREMEEGLAAFMAARAQGQKSDQI